jgi:hypothetical protein
MGDARTVEPGMPVATFNETTGWAGRRISFCDGRFTLESYGSIGAADVAQYDRRGQLTWAHAGLREWVMQLATVERAVAASPPGTPFVGQAVAVSSARPFVAGPTPRGRSMAAWKIALIVAAGLLVVGIGAAGAVSTFAHRLQAPPSTGQGPWKTYTNTAGGYRISYPASFHEASYDSSNGDPGLCARFIDSQGVLYVLGKKELLTTVIVTAKKLPGPVSETQAETALGDLAQRDAAITGDDAAAGMWDRRTVSAQVSVFQGRPCTIWETTYRCKRGSGQSSWNKVQPLLGRFADSFSTP